MGMKGLISIAVISVSTNASAGPDFEVETLPPENQAPLVQKATAKGVESLMPPSMPASSSTITPSSTKTSPLPFDGIILSSDQRKYMEYIAYFTLLGIGVIGWKNYRKDLKESAWDSYMRTANTPSYSTGEEDVFSDTSIGDTLPTLNEVIPTAPTILIATEKSFPPKSVGEEGLEPIKAPLLQDHTLNNSIKSLEGYISTILLYVGNGKYIEAAMQLYEGMFTHPHAISSSFVGIFFGMYDKIEDAGLYHLLYETIHRQEFIESNRASLRECQNHGKNLDSENPLYDAPFNIRPSAPLPSINLLKLELNTPSTPISSPPPSPPGIIAGETIEGGGDNLEEEVPHNDFENTRSGDFTMSGFSDAGENPFFNIKDEDRNAHGKSKERTQKDLTEKEERLIAQSDLDETIYRLKTDENNPSVKKLGRSFSTLVEFTNWDSHTIDTSKHGITTFTILASAGTESRYNLQLTALDDTVYIVKNGKVEGILSVEFTKTDEKYRYSLKITRLSEDATTEIFFGKIILNDAYFENKYPKK